MIKHILLATFFLLNIVTHAQITTNPAMPVASKKVTITFDSSKEARLGTFTSDLYAHTGVIIEGSSEWKHVIGTWNDNTKQPKLTNKGNGIYELEISPDINTFYSVSSSEKVNKLAFVLRSSDGQKQTGDLFIDVYQEGLVVSLSSPTDQAILDKNTATTISATASADASLKLKIGETVIAESTGQTISTSYSFPDYGWKWVIAEATSAGKTVYDSIQVFVKQSVTTQTKPTNYKKGINYLTETSVALVLWAPYKQHVYVLGDFNNWKPDETYQMKKDGDYFWLEMTNLTKGKLYAFQYLIDGKLKIADPYTEQTSDPWNDSAISSATYPNLMAYPEGKTQGIASVFQTGQEQYNWQVTNFQSPSKEKMVIYELHVRDFTAEHTYKAVREKLDYLKDLRINVLELMPVNEFQGNSSWGYNPSFYFAPDKYYGPKDELKKLVDECHQQGIAVVIDLVLNHSYEQSPFVQMYFDESTQKPAANNPWYNQTSNFQNPDAQWGYDFNHDSPYTRQLVDSINSFWMSQYKVDGFRFDFTKGFSNTSYGTSSWGSTYDAARISNLKRMATEIKKRKNDAIIIFEHLADNSEEKELAAAGILLWGNMNSAYAEAAMGYNENGKSELKGAIFSERSWSAPNLVSYMESHDEERLMYKNLQYGNSSGSYNVKQLTTALNRIKLNATFFIPLPGPKMIWEMGELGYDYSIDYNGRLGEKPIVWDYLKETNRTDLFQVFAKLNYLKQTYEEFSSTNIEYNLSGEIKTYKLASGNNYVIAVGNFGVIKNNATVSFPKTGTWYEYFSQQTTNVSSSSLTLSLEPGEFKLYTSRQLDVPKIITYTQPEIKGENKFHLFPNPCTDRLTIQSSEIIKSIRIMNISGNTVLNEVPNNYSVNICTQQLPSGVYFIQVLTKGWNTSKFIKNGI